MVAAKPVHQSISLRLASGEFDPLLEPQPIVKNERFAIQSYLPDEDSQAIAIQIQDMGGEIIEIAKGSRSKIKFRLIPSTLENVAAINGVQWIEPAPQWKLFNDKASDIMTVTNVRQNHGLFGSGQIVAVADSGFDQGSATPAQLHDDFENGTGSSRVLQIFDWVGDGAYSGPIRPSIP